jgi:LmbE family N-acetylglucosaminyl deacetylase
MLSLSFDRLKRVLCLGAHSDDIEIGCGGTLLKLARERPDLEVRWIVFSAGGRRTGEAQRSARSFLEGVRLKKVVVKRFQTSFFPHQGQRIKQDFEQIKKSFQPDLVFTHFLADRHQDHRILAELTWNTFRNHLVLEYEIPKYEGDLQQPNLFVPLSRVVCREKVSRICRFFKTQTNKHWFSEDLFYGLMRIRGIECASPTKYAEAFHCRKLVLGSK